jgi:phage gp46-like protein
MDFQVYLDQENPSGNMTFYKNEDIRTDIYMSLNTIYGNFFQNPRFGSKLSTIRKITVENINLARQYVEQAVAWLLNVGRATSINVIVEQDLSDFNRLDIKVTATQPDGLIITYQQFKRVV